MDLKVFVNQLQSKVDLKSTDFWSFLVFAPRRSRSTSFYFNAKAVIDPFSLSPAHLAFTSDSGGGLRHQTLK